MVQISLPCEFYQDMVLALCIKLKYFGVPLDGPTNMYCDNNAVVKNISIMKSTSFENLWPLT